jgi:hypothetical protein
MKEDLALLESLRLEKHLAVDPVLFVGESESQEAKVSLMCSFQCLFSASI